jgi:hypothetical protein
MNLELKSKDIINKQLKKYSESPWHAHFNTVLNTQSYQNIITDLLKCLQQKETFYPVIKDWLKPFDTQHIDKFDVVLIERRPEIIKFFPNNNSIIKLTLYPITFASDPKKIISRNDYDQHLANHITDLLNKKPNLVFVFCDISPNSRCVKAVKNNKIIMLPSSNYLSLLKKANHLTYHEVWHKIVKIIS